MTDNYKIYKITGEFVKTQTKSRIPLMMEVRAAKEEDALERVYSEIGSRHKVKRREIFIPKKGGIVEISSEEARNKIFKDMDSEDFIIYKD